MVQVCQVVTNRIQSGMYDLEGSVAELQPAIHVAEDEAQRTKINS